MSHIKTFARIRPTAKQYDDYDVTTNRIYVRVPEHVTSGTIWGGKTRQKCVINHEFKFDHVFREHASQAEVFDKVAVSTVQGFLNGYNGTIFAYGQTGSGKTYTVEGDARRYEDRGLAPRALSMIYKALESRTEEDIQIKVSYMEIYQEIGYDLLSTVAKSNSIVVAFPKVAVVEGSKGSCIIRNLSMHLAANEDVAQTLLFQGQTNRKVAETPMNQRSSRSHAVFTIYLTAKQPESDIVVKSKLHLVDLAGSERVSKTGTIGLQLNEAKFINLSLHHLEGVIIALQKEANGLGTRQARPLSSTSFDYKLHNREKLHKSLRYSPYGDNVWRWMNSVRPSTATGYSNPKFVPYRNSLLTMVLRDSLGGNCETVMVAAVSMEPVNLCESLSTFRFAQRVACITNTVRKNEEIDDKSMIKRLRKRIAELETQLTTLRTAESGDGTKVDDWVTGSKLTDEDKLQCAKIVDAYLAGRLKDPVMSGITNPLKFRECLNLLRTMVVESTENIRPNSAPSKPNSIESSLYQPPRIQDAWGENGVLRQPSKIPVQNHGNTNGHSQANSRGTENYQSDSCFNDDVVGDVIGSQVSVQTASTVIDKYVNKPSDRPNTSSTIRSQQLFTTHSRTSQIGQNSSEERVSNSPKGRVSNSPKERGSISPKYDILKVHHDAPRDQLVTSAGKKSPSVTSKSSTKPAGKDKGNQQWLAVKGIPVQSGPINGHTTQYKSPFERKREQEIRKLDKKLEKGSELIRGQQQDIRDLQNDVRHQQLVLLKNEVSGKLDKTKHQLEEHELYVNRLKATSTASNILEQELIVETQLKKRQHKMQKRLEAIENQLQQHNANTTNESNRTESSYPEKQSHPGSRHYGATHVAENRGKVNSRAVLEMLQTQDKQQTTAVSRLEKERIVTLSQQVEVKEVATRQKLREFREKLKQSQTQESSLGSVSDLSTETSNSRTTFDSPIHQYAPQEFHQNSQRCFDAHRTKDSETTNAPCLVDSDPFINIKPPSFRHPSEENRVKDPSAYGSKFRDPTGTVQMGPFSGNAPVTADQNVEYNRHNSSVTKTGSVSRGHLVGNLNIQNSSKRSNFNQDPIATFSQLLAGSHSQTDKSEVLRKMLEKPRSHTYRNNKSTDPWNSPYSRDVSRPSTQGSLNMGSASAFSGIHNNRLEFTTPVLEKGYEDLPSARWMTQHSVPFTHGESQVLLTSANDDVTGTAVESKDDATLTGYFSESVRRTSNYHRLLPNDNLTMTNSMMNETNSDTHKHLEVSTSCQRSGKSAGLAPRPVALKLRPSHSSHSDGVDVTGISQNATDSSKLLEYIKDQQNGNFNESFKSEVVTNFETCPRTSTENSDQSVPSFEARSRSSTKDSDQSIPSFEKYLPTEYVNQGHEDNFDGHKIGLKRSDFDTALDKMLNHDPSFKVTHKVVSQNEYNEFARDPRSKSKPVSKSRNKSMESPYLAKTNVSSKGRAETNSTKSQTPLSTKDTVKKTIWGPEAKYMSISDRLKGYQPFRQHVGRSLDDSDVIVNNKPVRLTDETTEGVSGEWKKQIAKSKHKPDLDLDRFKIKIKAMDEPSREEVFVNTARQQRNRIQKIRQARSAAETIQRAWRKYRR